MKTLIIPIFMLVSFCIQARDYSFTVISQDENGMLVKFELTDSRLKTSDDGLWVLPYFNGGSFIMQQGYPDLMKAVRSFVVPSSGKATTSVISSEYYDHENIYRGNETLCYRRRHFWYLDHVSLDVWLYRVLKRPISAD